MGLENKLIITRADKNIQKLSDLTHPFIKRYADKCGADFMVLDHETDCPGDGRWHFRILKCHDLFDKYDRILSIDTDAIVKYDCLNVFDVVPFNMIGTVFEDVGTREKDRRERILEIQKIFGDIGWRRGYINTGFFLTSSCHRDIFTKINDRYYEGWGSDDLHLMYNIRRMCFNIYQLPWKFNGMSMFFEDWNVGAREEDAYVLHFAGGQEEKLTKIRKCINALRY